MTDARVTVKNLDTNAIKELTTSVMGTFRVSLLPAGSYEVWVEKPGFAKFVQGPIVLRLNQTQISRSRSASRLPVRRSW